MGKFFYSLVLFIVLFLSACSVKNQDFNGVIKKDLHYAVRVNDLQLVNQILDDTNINKKDEYGYTPLHIAAKFNHFDIAKTLIIKGALINTYDNHFESPLIDSVKKGNMMMSELLICNGAKVNDKDKNGTTLYELSKKLNDNRVAKLISSKNIQQRCIGKVITPNKPTNTQFYNQISIDDYGVINDNTPTICGDIYDEDVRRIQISFDSGESVIEGEIMGKRWCAQVKDRLLNGYYRVDAISVNSLNERGFTFEELQIEAANNSLP